MTKLGRQFLLEDLQVLAVEADSDPVGEENEHIDWFVSFAPEREERSNARVVIGTLHAAIADCRAYVTVGSMFFDSSSEDVQDDLTKLPKLIAESSALETLYDYARTNLGALFGMLGIYAPIPRKSPDPEVSPFNSDDEDEESPDVEVIAVASQVEA
ncbi:hypothetical protein B7R21_09835 [Subtercola boreus]|uniref:Uncharacterized protein n=1 Tax=Subtercola boreus TaxID=120213 RepID=A0A3E0VUW9_9MICO|nr:hypothetical protein [Subtercola boreus]RFA12637.1 hypothetical protein B7R21_09835 [Subtercola boreus]